MQRLFVMFPDRGPGAGLLWLRLCVVAALCVRPADAGWLTAACLLVALSLLLGVLTPLSALLAVPCLFWQSVPWALALLPLALLALGPGAYSLDARLFGRRVLERRSPPFG
ncbi:hypothetical protein ACODUO_11135 [Stenotrophomonas maltophilia]